MDSELASKVGMYTILTHPPPRATEGFAIPTIPASFSPPYQPRARMREIHSGLVSPLR